MTQRSIEERMAEMQQRIEALRRAKQRLEARQTAAERKRQERRRYLLGSFLMEHLDRDEQLRAYVQRELPGFLQEERDRKLFAELLETDNVTDGAASPTEAMEETRQRPSGDGQDEAV
jgi:hypothetical protein